MEKSNVGRIANFIFRKLDGAIWAYTGKVISENQTHITIQDKKGREISLLLANVQKIEWM